MASGAASTRSLSSPAVGGLGLLAVLMALVVGVRAERSPDSIGDLGPTQEVHGPVDAIELETPDLAELFDNADVVADALVQSIQDMSMANEPHLVSSRNAEQQRILASNPQIRVWTVNVTAWHKGSSPVILHLIRMRSGPLGGNDLISDLNLISVGTVYRFDLSRDQVWFTGNDHYILGAAETII